MNAETFSGLWYINEPFARRMESIMIPRLVAGLDPIPAQFKPNSTINIFDEDGDFNPVKYRLGQYLKAGGGDVAVLPLTGSMSRFGLCGEGNEFLSQVLEQAAVEKSVKAIVIKGHTPGGTVDSVEMLADTIKNFPKPIVGYVAGMVASAGVFAMSQCDSIVMEDAVMSEIGSIGVLQVYVNQQAALEKAGIDVRIFRAGDSVDKARVNGIEPLTDELLAEIQADLDACMKTFKGYVRRGRAGKLTGDEIFTGRMYKKKEALNFGLVDRLGSLQDAIKVAKKL